MRLTEIEISSIKNIILSVDNHADIYLYGSRVDDAKRGGDIDILVISKSIDFNDKLEISG
jgi:predicted nucleotidyltransferase